MPACFDVNIQHCTVRAHTCTLKTRPRTPRGHSVYKQRQSLIAASKQRSSLGCHRHCCNLFRLEMEKVASQNCDFRNWNAFHSVWRKGRVERSRCRQVDHKTNSGHQRARDMHAASIQQPQDCSTGNYICCMLQQAVIAQPQDGVVVWCVASWRNHTDISHSYIGQFTYQDAMD